MSKKKILLRPLLIFISLIVTVPAQIFAQNSSENPQIIINEIAASESSDAEWIEIYNRGETQIDLSGWKFFENNANHGLTAWRGDAVLQAREYTVIANKPEIFLQKYAFYSGKILDSSWSSLKEDGEEIGLKNASAEFVEKFTFPAFEYAPRENRSIERINPDVDANIASNWTLHPNINSVGQINFAAQPRTGAQNQPVAQGRSGAQNSLLAQDRPNAQNPAPIQNQPNSQNRSGAQNEPASQNQNNIQTQPTSQNPAQTNNPTAPNNGTTHTAGITATPLRNNTNPGQTRQTQPAQNINALLDQLSDSYGLKCELTGTITIEPKNAQKSINKTSAANKTQTNNETSQQAAAGKNIRNGDLSNGIKITELLPNPNGNQEEWIELFNDSNSNVNLGNWQLKDASKTGKFTIPDTVILKTGEYKIFPKSETGLSLNNSNETVSLLDFKSSVKDNISYEKSQKGKSYALVAGIDSWEWTDEPTPAEENQFFETIEGEIQQVATNELGENALTLLAGSSSVTVNFEQDILNPQLAQVSMPPKSRVVLLAEKTGENYILRNVKRVEPPAPAPETNTKGANAKVWIIISALIVILTATALIIRKWRSRRSRTRFSAVP